MIRKSREIRLYKGIQGAPFNPDDFDKIDTIGLDIVQVADHIGARSYYDDKGKLTIAIKIDDVNCYNQITRELITRDSCVTESITSDGYILRVDETLDRKKYEGETPIEINIDNINFEFRRYMAVRGVEMSMISAPWHVKGAIEEDLKSLGLDEKNYEPKLLRSMLGMYDMLRNDGQILTSKVAYNGHDFKTISPGYDPVSEFYHFCDKVTCVFPKRINTDRKEIPLNDYLSVIPPLLERMKLRDPEYFQEWDNLPNRSRELSDIRFDMPKSIEEATKIQSVLATDVSPEDRSEFDRFMNREQFSNKTEEEKTVSILGRLAKVGQSLYAKVSGTISQILGSDIPEMQSAIVHHRPYDTRAMQSTNYKNAQVLREVERRLNEAVPGGGHYKLSIVNSHMPDRPVFEEIVRRPHAQQGDAFSKLMELKKASDAQHISPSPSNLHPGQ